MQWPNLATLKVQYIHQATLKVQYIQQAHNTAFEPGGITAPRSLQTALAKIIAWRCSSRIICMRYTLQWLCESAL